MQIFILSFIILTVLHPIGDFILPRRLHHTFFFLTNPFHWLYDLSPCRRHHLYHTERVEYWRWLGVDQTCHMVLNVLLAFLLELLLC